jgi:UDP-N-acetyl-D-glucosamine dehydrogenase
MDAVTVETALAGALPALLRRIDQRAATVGVIGLGYVGLPLVLAFAEAGFPVLGLDVDPAKAAALAAGESYIHHIGTERVRAAFARADVEATSDFARLAECDAILVCVPTPLGHQREPDLRYVRATAEAIASRLRPGQLVVLESTSYPGTTREELQQRFARTGLVCGRDYFLAFSPERADPGSAGRDARAVPKLVGGVDEPSRVAALALYGAVLERVVAVSCAEVAESAKLLENIFRAVNIALVNELKVVFARMGIDIWEVIAAASTKPFGFMPFYPGPGLGGHCIPLDPFYLAWKAAEHGAPARFIELAGEINAAMPRYVVERVVEAIAAQGKRMVGARVLVLGLSYKPDIDDDRESPSYALLELLAERGAVVAYCDPYIPATKRARQHDFRLRSVPCTAAELGRHDAVLVATAHSQFTDPELYVQASLVIDTRNIVRAAPGRVVVRA